MSAQEHIDAANAGTLVGGPRRYRKLPVVIEALQFTGDNIEALWDWAGADTIYGPVTAEPAGTVVLEDGDTVEMPAREADPNAYVCTLEGQQALPVGNWLIRGVAGEFYSCDPDIFAQTYEPA